MYISFQELKHAMFILTPSLFLNAGFVGLTWNLDCSENPLSCILNAKCGRCLEDWSVLRIPSRADLNVSGWLGIVYYFSYRGVYYRTIVFTMSFVNDTIIFTPLRNRYVPRSTPEYLMIRVVFKSSRSQFSLQSVCRELVL